MIECKKKVFKTMQDASLRCGEINSINSKKNEIVPLFRPYKCDKCGKIHLTKMAKGKFKYYDDKEYRHKVNLTRLLKTETEYWEGRLSKK